METISIRYCRKKYFHLKINILSTTDNIVNSKPSDILYTVYLNKDISFGDIVYFEPKNIQYNDDCWKSTTERCNAVFQGVVEVGG